MYFTTCEKNISTDVHNNAILVAMLRCHFQIKKSKNALKPLLINPNRSLEIFESKVLQNVSHNHLKHQQLTNDLQIYCIFSDKMKEDFSNDRFGIKGCMKFNLKLLHH